MTDQPPKPVFRQLMLALPDMPDQIPSRGWRGWATKITTTPQAEAGNGKPKPTKPRRKKPAT